MASQIASILLPLNGGELSIHGTYKQYDHNGQSTPLIPLFDLIPDEDPLLKSRNEESFNLYDFIFDEQEKIDDPIIKPQLILDESNSHVSNWDPLDFLETLKKEGDANLYGCSLSLENPIEPLNKNSCLQNQLLSISDDLSKQLPLYQCLDDLIEYDLDYLNRNCVSPSSDHGSTLSTSMENTDYLKYELTSFTSIEDHNDIQGISPDLHLSPTSNYSYDSDSNSSIGISSSEEMYSPLQIIKKLAVKKNPTKIPASYDKKAKKKQQNRESALRYRERKRKENSSVDIELKALEDRHEFLLSKVSEAKSEIAYLKNFLSDLICVDK